MPELRLRDGEFDGLDLHYLSEGSGAPVLLLHGLGGFAGVWRHTLPALGRQGRAIALDLPGFGLSGKPPGPYPLAFFARAIESFRRALGLERLALAGHSFGGAVAVAYALAYPSRVRRLALLGAVVPGVPCRVSWIYGLLALPILGELLAGALRPGVLAAALRRCFFRPDPQEVDYLVRESYPVRASAAGRAAFLSTLRCARADLRDDTGGYQLGLASFRPPVLVIHGLQDRVVPPVHAGAVVAALPRAEARWLDRCGHFPQIERRETVNAWLADFLVTPGVPRS